MHAERLSCLCLLGTLLGGDLATVSGSPPRAVSTGHARAASAQPLPTVSASLFDAARDEAFLRDAALVDMERLAVGVTHSHKVTLSDGTRTAWAVWKTIDDYVQVKRWADSPTEIHFSDSYRNEIAAYELDKLLGLGMVPPTVPRRLRGDKGSLQLWLKGTITESERLRHEMSAPDTKRWNEQMLNVRLFHRLTYNADYKNVRNLLVDDDFRIYIIDNSRSFRPHPKLFSEQRLRSFSREILSRLRGLRKEELAQTLGPWLRKRQIEGLWRRCGLILELAERLVSERGEAAALFP